MDFTKSLRPVAIASALFIFTACGDKGGADSTATVSETPQMDTADKKISYVIGYQTADRYSKDEILDLDQALLLKGLQDAFEGKENAVSEADATVAQQELQGRIHARQEAAAAEAKSGGLAFLEANKSKDGVIVTDSGLQYMVLNEAEGDVHPTATDTVKVHYHGTLTNGDVFDSSVDRGEPISFPLNGVIKGWTEGVQLMTVGDKFRFFIPSELGYGARDSGPIPANSVLIFDVELLGIGE